MKNKKAVLAIMLISAGIGLLFFYNYSFSNDAGTPPGNKPSSSVGAWYDETWQASGFYILKQSGLSDNYHYEYIDNAVTSTKPTFTKDAQKEDTETVDGHKHEYTAGGTSLPQDIVITEWRVTGHVHFSSGL